MLRWLFRIGRWVYEVADIGVQLTVGWTVAFGALMAFAAGTWAFFLEWGPLSIPAACLAAILGMMAFEDGQKVWQKWRRGNEATLRLLQKLNRLTEEGSSLVARYELCVADERFKMPTPEEWTDWRGRCEKVVSEISFNEVYGLRSQMDAPAYYNKLRLITMRYAENNPFSAREVLADG